MSRIPLRISLRLRIPSANLESTFSSLGISFESAFPSDEFSIMSSCIFLSLTNHQITSNNIRSTLDKEYVLCPEKIFYSLPIFYNSKIIDPCRLYIFLIGMNLLIETDRKAARKSPSCDEALIKA